MVVVLTAKLVFCFGPKLGLKGKTWAKLNNKLTPMPNKRGREPKHIVSIGSIGGGRGGEDQKLYFKVLN